MNDIEAFISEHPNGSFTQSEAWERVKCHFTHETLSIHDKNGTINGAARIHIRRVPLLGGTVFYAPRGYVCDFHDAAAVRRLTEKAVHLARAYRACMLKIDPMIESDDSQAIQNLIDAGFTYAAEKNGSDTVVIPLNRQELADYLAVDRSALSAVISALRSQGVIDAHKNRFTLYRHSSATHVSDTK